MKVKLGIGLEKHPLFRATVVISCIATIFFLDLTTDAEIAISTMYAVIVLVSTRFYDRRGVILISATCIALTVISCSVEARGDSYAGIINSAIGVLVTSFTCYLVLKIDSTRSATQLLTETNRLRDALVGAVSHELRTPMATIIGGASILADTPSIASDPRLGLVANSIRDEAVRLNNDIQNFLDAARITSDGLRARRDWTDATDVIGAAIERLRKSLADHRLEVNYDRDLPLLYIDPRLIEQALGQVIANARKFSPPSSTIRISATVKDRQIIISVSDKGVGLTPEEKAHLAERFFRGPRHIGKISGSGLGLWIANTFVVNNGGTLEALSKGQDLGTTINITFPIVQKVRPNSGHSEQSAVAEAFYAPV